MYRENPAGTAKIYLVAEQGKIVAHLAHIPVDLKVGNEITKACQVADFMSHPDSTFKAMFLLERRVLREAEKEGLHITFGFPTEKARPGFIKVGYFEIAFIRPMFKPLNLENILKTRTNNRFLLKVCALAGKSAIKTLYRTRKPPAIKGLTMNQVSHFDHRINQLWAKTGSSHQIMVARNKEYLNWRYAPPDDNYTIYVAEKAEEVHGYLVLRCTQQEGRKVVRIFDIVGQSEEVIRCLVFKAVEHSQEEKADVVYCSMIANRIYFRALRKNGFISTRFIRGTRFGAYSSSPHISKAFLNDPRNWFVQLGDTDAL